MIDMKDVRSPDVARAAEQAITERKNLLIVSSPGIGPTMIARRVPTILPPLSDSAKRWIAIERDAAQLPLSDDPPLRAPHHTVSDVALCGNYDLRAGELQLARFGVLYLDDFLEFRLPTIDRLAYRWRRMAHAPLVVASMLPCTCGWKDSYSETKRECCCKEKTYRRYQERVDRFLNLIPFEIQITMPCVSRDLFRQLPTGETSEVIRSRVIEAQ